MQKWTPKFISMKLLNYYFFQLRDTHQIKTCSWEEFSMLVLIPSNTLLWWYYIRVFIYPHNEFLKLQYQFHFHVQPISQAIIPYLYLTMSYLSSCSYQSCKKGGIFHTKITLVLNKYIIIPIINNWHMFVEIIIFLTKLGLVTSSLIFQKSDSG